MRKFGNAVVWKTLAHKKRAEEKLQPVRIYKSLDIT